jgi:hypothetical protein
MARRGSLTLEALLLLAAYAALIGAWAGLEREFVRQLAPHASESAQRLELASSCLAVDQFSLAGEHARFPLGAEYLAGGRALALGGGPALNCSTGVARSGGLLLVDTRVRVRG